MSTFSDSIIIENEQEKRQKETDLAFKMLNDRLNEQKQEEEENALTAEILYLQHKSLVMMAKSRLPKDTLRNITYEGIRCMRDIIYGDTIKHKCSSDTCRFLNLKKSTKFIEPFSNGISVATGLIYVCITTGTAHTCGKYCNSMSYSDQGEGFSCIISGLCSDVRIGVHKLGNSAEGKCHFVNQNDTFVNNQDIIQSHNNLQDLFDFDPDMDKQRYRVENSLQDARLIHNMVKNRVRSNNNNNNEDSSVGGKRKRVNENGVEFRRKEGDEYGFFSRIAEPVKKKRKRRNTSNNNENINIVSNKSVRSIVQDFLNPSNKEEIYRSKIVNKEKEAELEINNYYKKCRKEGKPPIFTDIMAIHAEKTMDTYTKAVPKMFGKPKYMDDMNYFSNCLVHLWDILYKTPFAKKNDMNFQVCTVALLYFLKDGYKYIFKIDEEGNILPENAKNCLEKEITIIPKHFSLETILIDETDIKKLHKSTSRNSKVKKKKTRRNNYKNVSLIHGKKDIGKCFLSVNNSMENISEIENYMLSSYMKIRPD